MVLYHVQSAYQLLESIEHRQLMHKNERAILLIYNFMEERYPHYKELETFGFFDEVYIYPHWRIKFDFPEEVAKKAEAAFSSTVHRSINEFDKIYVAGIHVAFTTFLLSKKIKFSIFEDGSGALSRPEILENIEKTSNIKKYTIMKHFGLYRPCDFDSRIVYEKYCDRRNQVNGFTDDLAVDFNLLDNYIKLSPKAQSDILTFFRCPKSLDSDKNTVLLLSQHFANLQQLSFEEHVYIYQVLFDYFLEGKKVIIKFHPDDVMYYQKLFPDIEVIREKFPAELIPFIFKNRPSTIATITSTGINSLMSHFENYLKFDPSFEQSFKQIRKYYTAMMICKHLSFHSIKCVETDGSIIRNMFEKRNIVIDDINPDAVIINNTLDEEQLKLYDAQKAIIFLDSDKNHFFFNSLSEEQIGRLLPIEIQVEKIREEDNYFCESEIIYVLPNNKETENKMKDFQYSKDEKASGNQVNVRKMSKEEIRIKVLEGMLDATEKRLLFYKELAEKKAADE